MQKRSRCQLHSSKRVRADASEVSPCSCPATASITNLVQHRSSKALPSKISFNKSSARPQSSKAVPLQDAFTSDTTLRVKGRSRPKLSEFKRLKLDNGGVIERANRSKFNPSNVDILGLMRSFSETNGPRYRGIRTTIELPEDFLRWFSGTSEANMWLHHAESGCKVVVPSRSGQDRYRRVLLEGSNRSCESASRHLKQMLMEFIAHGPRNVLSGTAAGSESMDMDAEHKSRPPVEMRVDEVPEPAVWSIRTFYDHVIAITGHRAPRSIERLLYPGDQSYSKVAGSLLAKLFSDPTLSHCLSTAALHQALQFFCRRTHLATDTGQVWRAASDAGIVPDLGCYNFELKRCLTVNNMGRVEYLLHHMNNRGISPNTETWSIILEMVHTVEDRRTIVELLMKSRLVKAGIDMQKLACAVVKADFAIDIREKDDPVFSLAARMRESFGPDWLSQGVIATMIQQCIKSRSLYTTSDVLKLAQCHGLGLEQQASVVLLEAVRRTPHGIQDALTLLKMDLTSQDLTIIRLKADLLFKSAWSRGMLNMCRVLWKFAATHGTISYAMQKLVTTSLGRSTNTVSGEQAKTNAPLLAAITISSDEPIHDFGTRFPSLQAVDKSFTPAEHILRWVPNDGTRHEQLQLVHFLVERDLRAWQIYKPMEWPALVDALDEAYKKDTQWREEAVLENLPVSEALQLSVPVQMQYKSDSQPAVNNTQISLTPVTIQEAQVQTSPRRVIIESPKYAGSDNTKAAPLAADAEQRCPHVSEPAVSYGVLSNGLPSSMLCSSAMSPALALKDSCILDTLFHHLKLAWDTT